MWTQDYRKHWTKKGASYPLELEDFPFHLPSRVQEQLIAPLNCLGGSGAFLLHYLQQLRVRDANGRTGQSNRVAFNRVNDGFNNGTNSGNADGSADRNTDITPSDNTNGNTDGNTDSSAEGNTDRSTDTSVRANADGNTGRNTGDSAVDDVTGNADGNADGNVHGNTGVRTGGSTGGSTDKRTDSSAGGNTRGSTGCSAGDSTDNSTDDNTGGSIDSNAGGSAGGNAGEDTDDNTGGSTDDDADDNTDDNTGVGDRPPMGVDAYGVPGPRTSTPGDGWNALDHLGVWDCYLGHVKQSKDIPSEFHQPWAESLAEVMTRVESARLDGDPLALERALKWLFVVHQLLLRLDGGRRHGRRLIAAMRRRFEMWHRGELKELVVLWRLDVRKASSRRRERTLDAAATVEEAMKLIEDNCLSKAMVYLTGNGLGDMGNQDIREQLKRKHPQERREWDRSGIDDMPRLTLGSAREVFKDLERNSGVGADRFRMEYLICLVRGVMGQATRDNVLGQWDIFADRVVNNDFPAWFNLVWTTVVQFAPIKKEGPTPTQTEVRPVGCGGVTRRAIARMVKVAEKRSPSHNV